MRVLIIADTDLDGTGSAVVITKFIETLCDGNSLFTEGFEVEVCFPAREDLDTIFNETNCREMLKEYDRIYLCDTAPGSLDSCENIGTILASKIFIFDHHATNLQKLQPYAGNFASFNSGGLYIIEGSRCSAKLAFDILKDTLSDQQAEKFSMLGRFVELVNDLDMWHREFPRSSELGDYVATVGPDFAYPILLQIAHNPDQNVDNMEEVVSQVLQKKEHSLELARATLVEHEGYTVPFHSCIVDNWASWVAGKICPASGMLVMFDIARKSLSFRVGSQYVGNNWHISEGPKPNCLDFAEPLGGGGHPQAAGVDVGDLSPIFKKLSERLGELLLETYNDGKH